MNAATSRNDPLLVAGKVLVILITVVLVFSLVMLGIGVGALLTVGRGEVFDRIAAADAPEGYYWLVIAAFLLIMLAIGLALRFFKALHQIILSVDRGEPFEPANAARLRSMGWLAVAGQIVFIPLGVIETVLSPYLARLGREIEGGVGLDPGTLLLILVLFILARVFESGTDMRRDLEGTV